MSRALFLRHGESAHNAHTGAEALSEEEGDRLTVRGVAQARAAGEWRPGEGFAELLGRARRLRAELEESDEELPLLVGHGIFTRVFLLDIVLGEELVDGLGDGLGAPALERIWQMGSHNCGLSLFARGESRYPGGAPIPGWTCLTWMARPWDPP